MFTNYNHAVSVQDQYASSAGVHLAVHHSELRVQRKEGRSKSWQVLIPRGEVLGLRRIGTLTT